MSKKISKNQHILLFVSIVAVCSFIFVSIVGNTHKPGKYTWICLLPLSFMILSILCNRIYLLFGKSITVTLLISLMFFKNVMMPFIMAIGDGTFLSQIDTSSKMPYAIALGIYEELAVFFIINIMYKKIKNALAGSYIKPLKFETIKIKSFFKITTIILLVVLACLLCFPQLKSYFSLGVPGNVEQKIALARLRIAMSSSVPSLIYYSYIFLANILRWMLPISIIYKLYLSDFFGEHIKIVASLFVICISAIITTETIATSIFLAIALTLLLSRIYVKQRKTILFLSLGSIGIVGILALLLKSFGSGGIQSAGYGQISSILQAYFSGLENIAVADMIPEPVSLNELFGDVFRFIPYIMHFFKGFTTSTEQFNRIFFQDTDTVTQIIPMISQGARYFSFLFAPIFTIMFCWIAIRWEIKATSRSTLFDYTLCVIACVCFSMAIVMYSASLGLQLYLNEIAPLQFIIWFIHRLAIGKNYRQYSTI